VNKESRSKPLICFIDDNPDERKLFQDVFGCDDGAFRVITAETFTEAKARIEAGGEIPDLFVLDLYFPSGDGAVPEVDLKNPVNFIDDDGDLIKAYMNLETARKRYQAIRISQDQSPAGGLKLISQVKRTFPRVPAVTYTRKGTIEEAESARRAGVRFILQKPSGGDWEDTYRITRIRRSELERSFRRAMHQDPFELLNLIEHYARLLTSDEEIAILAEQVDDLRQKWLDRPESGISAADVDRLMDGTSHPFLRALIYQLQNAEF
jgi:DNA-binding NtrC family response regulator